MKRAIIYSLSAAVSIVLMAAAFGSGYLAGSGTRRPPALVPVRSTVSPVAPASGEAREAAVTPGSLEMLFRPFWESWTIVHDNYVDQPVDDIALMRGAITGMLAALGDEYTGYMDPASWTSANDGLQGSFEGIGAIVDTTGDYLTITEPMPGSPAERAGLLAGDQVVAVDGKDVTGMDPEQVRGKVVGPAGSQVTLTISRMGVEQPFDVTLTRAKIVVPSVESEMLGEGLAYLKINDFGANTADEVGSALQDLMAHNPGGLVLDLRNNGGGYLNAAVDVASQFLREDTLILYEEYGDGRREPFRAGEGGLSLELPIVVLVNAGTASAAEVVAGALQGSGRAQLVGVQTYGKGSVQIWVPLSDEQGGVRVTIAKWLTPDGRSIHKLGLTPDAIVPLTDQDSGAGLDPQMGEAVELLSQP